MTRDREHKHAHSNPALIPFHDGDGVMCASARCSGRFRQHDKAIVEGYQEKVALPAMPSMIGPHLVAKSAAGAVALMNQVVSLPVG